MSKALELVPPSWQTGVQATVLRGVFGLPRPLMRGLAGKPIRLDGQELALDAQLLLKLQQLTGTSSLSATTVEQARVAMRQALEATKRAPLPGVEATELRIGDLAARLYRPTEATEPSKLLVYYHGGGWVIGDLDSHDDLCRFLAKHAEVRVLSVDYRLAPEHPFPAAVDDAISGYRYALEYADELGTEPDAIAVAGDSAGGNLAAVVAHHATRSDLTKPVFQLLLYPAVDATVRRRSRELFGNGFLLTDGDMNWFMNHYLPDADGRRDPRVSVLLADDLSGLPPAHVVTAGFDPLRDEGEAYARRLEESGVPVVARRFPDLIHGFANLRQAGGRFQEAMVEVVGTLRAGLALHGR
jgi:acetyl esterase